MLIAEIGSLTLEFTRLSQVSGDPRYYDAVQRIMDVLEAQQDLTNLPGCGLWRSTRRRWSLISMAGLLSVAWLIPRTNICQK